jgi:ABC-type sugar transport system substrate-binding protein
MENLIQRKVDAIIIGTTSVEGIAPVVEEAVKKGIPVVGVGSQPKTDKLLTRILADDYGMGKIRAEYLGKSLGSKGKVAMISGSPGLNWTIDRAKGFRETLSKLHPSLAIVAEQWTPVSRPQSLSLMEDWIQRFPD